MCDLKPVEDPLEHLWGLWVGNDFFEKCIPLPLLPMEAESARRLEFDVDHRLFQAFPIAGHHREPKRRVRCAWKYLMTILPRSQPRDEVRERLQLPLVPVNHVSIERDDVFPILFRCVGQLPDSLIRHSSTTNFLFGQALRERLDWQLLAT